MSTQQSLSGSNLHFDPDSHPKDTLKQFREFCRLFELRYDAQYPDPPQTSMDAAIRRWKLTNTTEDVQDPKPTLDDYDSLRDGWRSKDRVAKVIGMFSAPRLSSDWEAAESDEKLRQAATWTDFKTKLQEYYKPTENATLMNFQFRELSQRSNETFPAFCNRVEAEAKMCHFKCTSNDCTAETTAVRDQLIIGTNNIKIREEALMKSWQLKDLRIEGMKLESAARGEAEISGGVEVNKLGRYSYANINKQQKVKEQGAVKKFYKELRCFNCNEKFNCPPYKHKEVCKARNVTCKICTRTGHFTQYCRSKPGDPVRFAETESSTNDTVHPSYPLWNANLFRVPSSCTQQ